MVSLTQYINSNNLFCYFYTVDIHRPQHIFVYLICLISDFFKLDFTSSGSKVYLLVFQAIDHQAPLPELHHNAIYGFGCMITLYEPIIFLHFFPLSYFLHLIPLDSILYRSSLPQEVPSGVHYPL